MSLPLEIVRNATLQRSVELYCKTSNNSWLDRLSELSFYPMKLFTARVATRLCPVGCMQSITLTLDDLMYYGPFAQPHPDYPSQWLSRFTKGKLHNFSATLSSTAAPMNRAGRYGMALIWFTEFDALNANKDLGRRQKADLPDIKTFFTMPGVKVAPCTAALSCSWEPPANSWVQDYIRIGRSHGKGTGASWGLPFGRLIMGYQNFSDTRSDVYTSDLCAGTLTVSAEVTFAELGARVLRKQFESEYDVYSVRVYSEHDSHCELPLADVEMLWELESDFEVVL